jgi:transcriptional regulator with XRE-family HTH domain
MPAGKELERLQKASGLSVAKFASIIGLDPERMRNWMRRDSSPIDRNDIETLENYFDVPMAKLSTIDCFEIKQKKNGITGNQDAKIISLLEDKVKMLEGQVSFLKTELLEQVKVNTSLAMTNQDLLINTSVHIEGLGHRTVAARVGKANAENYQKAGVLTGRKIG